MPTLAIHSHTMTDAVADEQLPVIKTTKEFVVRFWYNSSNENFDYTCLIEVDNYQEAVGFAIKHRPTVVLLQHIDVKPEWVDFTIRTVAEYLAGLKDNAVVLDETKTFCLDSK